MANVEASSPFRSEFLEVTRHHFSPDFPLQRPLIGSASPPHLPPPRAGHAFDLTRDIPPQHISRASSPCALASFSDFSDIILTSPLPATLRSGAPQHTPVLPPPQPAPRLQLISLSTVTPDLPDEASDSSLSPSPPASPAWENASDRLPRFHPQRPVRPLPSASTNTAQQSRRSEASSMTGRGSIQLDRLGSQHTVKTPSPRPRSQSRRESNSSDSRNSASINTRSRSKSGIIGACNRSLQSTDDSMPATTRRASASTPSNSEARSERAKPRPAKRQRSGPEPQPDPPPAEVDVDDEDWEQPLAKRRPAAEAATDVIDLVDAETAPPPPKPKPTNQIKLSSLQCSICMDDMSCLTLTHCGHLFCGACLHTALHVNANKRVCPICRSKIDLAPPSGSRANRAANKAYWPLSLKVMTATRKGKRKDGDPS